jgi:hypothetical protein
MRQNTASRIQHDPFIWRKHEQEADYAVEQDAIALVGRVVVSHNNLHLRQIVNRGSGWQHGRFHSAARHRRHCD